MRRRALLASFPALVALEGCLSAGSEETPPPTGVYRPARASGVRLASVGDAGSVRVALLYSRPARFWEVVGETTYPRDADPDDSVHLMVTVWDPATGVVFPETGLSLEVRDGDTLVAEEAVYPMLSQSMGFHYGDNVVLPGDGDYTVLVRVGGLHVARTGDFAGRFEAAASVELPCRYRRAERDALAESNTKSAREAGSLDLSSVEEVPLSRAPRLDTLPGRHLGTIESDDALLVVVAIEDPKRFDADTYLAVSARTPYNRLVLPSMGLSARLDGNGQVAFDGRLERTVDPVLGYHYGAPVSGLETADRLILTVTTPPQVARHAGYETAFLDLPAGSLSL